MPHLIYAEVLARHGRFEESEEAYERSLAIGPTTEAVVGLFEVMVTVGERDRALERLERWVERNPSDLRAKRALGLGYIAANRLDPALAIHEELDQVIEDDPLLLNNLGRIYQLKKDPRARRYAERAVELAPNWAIGLDTLGWIHVTEGRPEDGLPLLREAHARAAQNPMIRYHLAAALGQLGREREAVAQLNYLLANAGDLAWIDDVRKLRESLGAK